jgi:ElaA protein
MEKPGLNKILKSFKDLTTDELYEILRLRSEVFVMEQNCLFLDMDNKDQKCHHLMLYKNELLAAYTRIVPPGLSYPEMSIGRVVSSPQTRGGGIGRELMNESITACYELFGDGPIKIGAQLYLKPFYESLGFVQQGDVYREDEIEHIIMVKP